MKKTPICVILSKEEKRRERGFAMIKILFVCHGNICRSPMAEFVMKDMLEKLGREYEFEVASAATSTEEIWNGIGNPVYPSVKKLWRSTEFPAKGKGRGK